MGRTLDQGEMSASVDAAERPASTTDESTQFEAVHDGTNAEPGRWRLI